MENSKIKSLTGQVQSLLETNIEFPRWLKQRLVIESNNVKNPYKFIAGLLTEGVLCDGSSEPEASVGLKEMMVLFAISIACSKGADTIGGLMKALEGSGNSQLVSILQAWTKENFGIEIGSELSQPKEGASAVQSSAIMRLPNNSKGPAATAIFAATTEGIIFLDLQTLEATLLTKEPSHAVAVNHNLKKVYWAEVQGKNNNSRIMRSNFDGSAKEVIVPPICDCIYILAIDEGSGNVYYAPLYSRRVEVCSALGKHFAAAISSSPSVQRPVGIAVDSENGGMYWCNFLSGSLVHANLDGTNATIISSQFQLHFAITLDQRTNILFWSDWEAKTIGTVDGNGSNKRVLVKLDSKPSPIAIQVDANMVYFSNLGGKNIQSVDRDSGKELKTIFSSTAIISDFALLNDPVKEP